MLELALGNLGVLMICFASFMMLTLVLKISAKSEWKLDLLIRHAGIDLRKVATEEAAVLKRAGKKTKAIKMYRG